MSDTLTLDGLAVSLRVLRLLAAEFGHLPAPDVQVSPIFPNQLELSFHDGLSRFEAWREAVGIAPDAVDYREQSGSRTRVLKASAEYADAVVVLVGYGDALVPVGGAA
ncbi:hypothetical protein [Streptomyces sp. NPDC002132]|uniref:hypothetical protein n=1 Tax=unclassified Streptomyces TaxID=2593676 RepID=UPI003321F275